MERFTLPLVDGCIVQISASMKELTGYVVPYDMTSVLSNLEAEYS